MSWGKVTKLLKAGDEVAAISLARKIVNAPVGNAQAKTRVAALTLLNPVLQRRGISAKTPYGNPEDPKFKETEQ